MQALKPRPGTKAKQLQRRRTGVSAPHELRMNRSNTSFESSRPRGVRLTTSPSRSSRPKPSHSEIVSENVRGASSPKSDAIFFRSTPRFRRRPRKKVSSSAPEELTCVLLYGPPAMYSSSESGAAKRTASFGDPEQCSMEWASTPRPRYGWRVQYLRLWRDWCPSRAKLD